MGVFTRFKDIVSANLNSMLDNAEDPRKMIRLMIREMEETLVELKASCAGTMAECRTIERELGEVNERVGVWAGRAGMAVEKGRDDLAREALVEKRRWAERAEVLAAELAECENLASQAKDDIAMLEDKLNTAREKQRLLVERHSRANHKKRAHENARKSDSIEAARRFERFEQAVDRMEAEAELVNGLNRPRPEGPNLDDRFAELEGSEDIEAELRTLKEAAANKQ